MQLELQLKKEFFQVVELLFFMQLMFLKMLKLKMMIKDMVLDIVRKALSAPLKQIAQNAGHDGAVIAGKIIESKDNSHGFDAQSGKFCDLVKAGIVDPTKVVRTALIDAVSVAALLTTTEAMITDKPEDKSAPAMPDMGGMGGMGGGMPQDQLLPDDVKMALL